MPVHSPASPGIHNNLEYGCHEYGPRCLRSFYAGSRLIDHFARALSPTKSIRFAAQRDHADSMIFRIASRIAGDGDHISSLQRLAGHALAAQLACSAPLDGPSLNFTFLIR